ncbi:MAG TPA: hypothetical protein VFK21_04425 [Gammaproteobacteria bacterium]|nr:hypothetical protein [Gammaproteobacteria bacterium]
MESQDAESMRRRNAAKIAARALDACAHDKPETKVELEILLNGPHARAVGLAILDSAFACRTAMRRDIPLWIPFGSKEQLLYDLVGDHSEESLRRVKNLLDAGWDPNLAIPGTHRTPLMQVTMAWNPRNRDLAALLLAAGAKVDARSAGGQTALDYAPVAMRNFIQHFVKDIEQDTTNRVPHTNKSD